MASTPIIWPGGWVVRPSRFGTWSHLGTTRSSARDVCSRTATLSFRAARFARLLLTLRTTELADSAGHPLPLFVHAWVFCILKDLDREAAALGIERNGARVTAAGGFDPATWQSTGINYWVDVSSDAPPISSPTCSRWSTR